MSDQIEKTFYDYFYRMHSEKGEMELSAIISTNAQKILALPNNVSGAMRADAEQWRIESKVCKAILDDRKNKKEAAENAFASWKENEQNRVNRRFLNLPAAASSLGQLIAAILEEENLTIDELAGWCDELAVLERSELEKLLQELVAEKILQENEGRYECINVCTENLYPENPVEWGMKRLIAAKEAGEIWQWERMEIKAELILDELVFHEGPMTAEEIQKELKCYTFKVDAGECLPEDINLSKGDIIGFMNSFVKCGVLEICPFGKEQTYYFCQLGKTHSVESSNIDGIIQEIRDAIGGKNLTDIQVEDLDSMREVLRVLLENDNEMLVTEIMAASPALGELTNQRVSSLLRKLRTCGYVKRTERERKSYFSINE